MSEMSAQLKRNGVEMHQRTVPGLLDDIAIQDVALYSSVACGGCHPRSETYCVPTAASATPTYRSAPP